MVMRRQTQSLKRRCLCGFVLRLRFLGVRAYAFQLLVHVSPLYQADGGPLCHVAVVAPRRAVRVREGGGRVGRRGEPLPDVGAHCLDPDRSACGQEYDVPV